MQAFRRSNLACLPSPLSGFPWMPHTVSFFPLMPLSFFAFRCFPLPSKVFVFNAYGFFWAFQPPNSGWESKFHVTYVCHVVVLHVHCAPQLAWLITLFFRFWFHVDRWVYWVHFLFAFHLCWCPPFALKQELTCDLCLPLPCFFLLYASLSSDIMLNHMRVIIWHVQIFYCRRSVWHGVLYSKMMDVCWVLFSSSLWCLLSQHLPTCRFSFHSRCIVACLSVDT